MYHVSVVYRTGVGIPCVCVCFIGQGVGVPHEWFIGDGTTGGEYVVKLLLVYP